MTRVADRLEGQTMIMKTTPKAWLDNLTEGSPICWSYDYSRYTFATVDRFTPTQIVTDAGGIRFWREDGKMVGRHYTYAEDPESERPILGKIADGWRHVTSDMHRIEKLNPKTPEEIANALQELKLLAMSAANRHEAMARSLAALA